MFKGESLEVLSKAFEIKLIGKGLSLNPEPTNLSRLEVSKFYESSCLGSPRCYDYKCASTCPMFLHAFWVLMIA